MTETTYPTPLLVPPKARRSAVGPDLQPTLNELSAPGPPSFKVPHAPAGALDGVPAEHLRASPAGLPQVDEPTVVHHFVRLSHLNYSVDSGLYPLGSCTMKYNPKVNEWAARLPGFADLHPLAPDALAQGTLCARSLEIRTLSYANPQDVTLTDCGRGVQIALIGVDAVATNASTATAATRTH